MDELLKILADKLLEVILGIISILLAIFTLVQRHQFNSFRKKVAIEEGIFKKPLLTIGLFDKYDVTTFIFAVPLQEQIWVIPLVLNIANIGDQTAREIEISYRTNKELLLGGNAKPTINNPGLKNAKIAQIDKAGPFVTVISSLDNIHQKQSADIGIHSTFRSATIFPHVTEATTKDGVNVSIRTWVGIKMPIDIVVSHNEGPPCSRRFDIQIIDTTHTNVVEFFKEYNHVIKQQMEGAITNRSLFKKIRKIFQTSNPPEIISLITFDSKKSQKKTLNNNKRKPIVNEVSVDELYIYEGVKFENGYFIPNVTQHN